MFKDLKKILDEKYGGKKFMELSANDRNGDEVDSVMDIEMEKLATSLGADSAYIFLTRDEPDGISTFSGLVKPSVASVIPLYSRALTLVKKVLPPDVIKSLAGSYSSSGGASDNDSEEEIKEKYKEATAKALGVAIESLPEKYKQIAKDNMDREMRKRGIGDVSKPSNKVSQSEDDLLDDLLK